MGTVLDSGVMKERLRGLGYERTGQVDGMGQFSVRGDIVDIFPLTEEVPVPPDASTVFAAEAEMAREAIMQTARMREMVFLKFFIVFTPFCS